MQGVGQYFWLKLAIRYEKGKKRKLARLRFEKKRKNRERFSLFFSVLIAEGSQKDKVFFYSILEREKNREFPPLKLFFFPYSCSSSCFFC